MVPLASIAGGRAIAQLMARPASAKTVGTWAKVFQEAATKGTGKTARYAQEALDKAANALAKEITQETGVRLSASELTSLKKPK